MVVIYFNAGFSLTCILVHICQLYLKVTNALLHWESVLQLQQFIWFRKCPKISFFFFLFHTILASVLLFMQFFLKTLIGMANSVDPDQTQGQSDLGLHCLYNMPFSQQLWSMKF